MYVGNELERTIHKWAMFMGWMEKECITIFMGWRCIRFQIKKIWVAYTEEKKTMYMGATVWEGEGVVG